MSHNGAFLHEEADNGGDETAIFVKEAGYQHLAKLGEEVVVLGMLPHVLANVVPRNLDVLENGSEVCKLVPQSLWYLDVALHWSIPNSYPLETRCTILWAVIGRL